VKAIQVTEPFKICIVEMPKPVIEQKDDVLIKVTSGGICGSDIGIWNGTNSLATYPRVIGHEFGGIVVETGAAVSGIQVGDYVAVDPVVSCGKCYACRIGRHNVCKDLEVIGVHRDGGFSEFVKVPEKNVHKFHQPFDQTLLGIVEPYTIGVEINRRAGISAQDKVLIMGSGPIGLCTLQIAKTNGAQVMITDVVAQRLEKAKELGADITVLINGQNLAEEVNKFTGGEGIPVVVDTVCLPQTFEQSVDLASPAGRVVVIGLKDQPSQITMAAITKKELTIVGSRLNCNCFDEVIDGCEKGNLHPEKLKTAMYNYQDIEKAFLEIKEHPQDVIKIVVGF